MRCADDPPGTKEGRLGLLKPQQKEEIQSFSTLPSEFSRVDAVSRATWNAGRAARSRDSEPT